MTGRVLSARHRRLAYLSGVAIGVPSLAVSWLAEDDGSALLRRLYVALGVALVLAGIAMLVRPSSVQVVERATLGTVAVLWMARLAYYTFTTHDAAQLWTALTPWAFMGVCLIAVFCYIVLPTRQAVLASVGFALAACALMTPPFVAAALADGDWAAVQALSRYQVYLVVTLVFVHLLARTKDSAVAAEIEAERMRTMAYRDPLTGLPNRRALTELLEREVDHARRTPLSLIAMDLDRFKSVNDTFGHHAGDLVLQAAALCVQNELRAGDTVGRWGGEEYLVVCPGSSRREASELAERLRGVLERELRLDGMAVTGSFGVVQYAAGMSVTALLTRADELMYEAKRAGRNRVVSAPATPRPRVGRLVPGQAAPATVEQVDSALERLDAVVERLDAAVQEQGLHDPLPGEGASAVERPDQRP